MSIFEFGGRITLLTYVLCSLSLFQLSYYKVLVLVCKKITKIQSNFPWGGLEYKRCIHWIRWEKVCSPFDKGGLDLKNIEEFNLALLLK